jgi:hypothetical protein
MRWMHAARALARMPILARTYTHGRSAATWMRLSEEVTDAMATGKPVVALESTIISHGKHKVHTDNDI